QSELESEGIVEPAAGEDAERGVLVVAASGRRTAELQLGLAYACARMTPEPALVRHAPGIGGGRRRRGLRQRNARGREAECANYGRNESTVVHELKLLWDRQVPPQAMQRVCLIPSPYGGDLLWSDR